MIRSMTRLAYSHPLSRSFARSIGKRQPLASDATKQAFESTTASRINVKATMEIEDEDDLYLVPPEAKATRVKSSQISTEVGDG